MSTLLSRQSFVIGFLSLFLLTAVAAASLIVPAVSLASRNSITEFVLHTPTDNVLRLSITTNDIIYNPQDKMIYATRPSSVGEDGNSITRINPLTGEVGASVYVGSEPNKIALSDNGHVIYVGLDGAYAVRRYDSITQTPGLQFPVGREITSSFPLGSPYVASDLAVAPGNPDLLAVARSHLGGTPAGVAIFKNGVQLPNTGPGHGAGASFLAFSNSASTLYGGGSNEGLRTMMVDESGVSDITGNPTSFGVAWFKFENNHIFTSDGKVINPETRTLLGTFFGISTRAFVPVSEAERVLYAVKESSSPNVTIKAFDINTFIQIGSLTIPDVGYDVSPTTLIRYGTNGLAMRTSNNQIYLIQTSLIPTESPLPMPNGTPATTPTPTPTVFAKFVRQVVLPNKDLIYNRREQKFYASVRSTAGTSRANSITRIEPTTGEIENSVAVGSDPGRLALSDDEQTLYVGIDGANAVRKVDLQTQTPGLQFSLGNGINGPRTAYDIDVMPNNPNAIAVSYGSSSYNYDGTDIFDDGVKRAQKANASGSVEFASPELLYVGENLLYKYAVSSDGLSPVGSLTTLNYGEAELVNGLLYTSSGKIVDPATGIFKGTFAGGGFSSVVAVDPPNNRIFFLTDTGIGLSSWSIRAYRMDNFLLVGSIPLPEAFNYGTPRRLIRWGTNGLAFTDNQEKIYFVQTNLVSDEGTVPASTPTPTATPTATPTPTLTPTPIPTPTPTPIPTFVRRVNFPVNDFVYSSSMQSIYASVPSIAGTGRGNTITKIDPTSGAIGSSVFVGSEPNKMAVSDDGKTVYVKLDGAKSIRLFDAPTETAGSQFNPSSPFYFVEDMAVQPGNPQVLAIANGPDGVAIFDNSVRRPNYSDGGATDIDTIDFADSATLYGYNNSSTGFDLIKFTVNSSGVTAVRVGTGPISGLGAQIKYANGLIYSTGGRVVNAANGTIVGTFPSGGSAMAIDQTTGRIFYINQNVLTAYDTNTFLKIGSVTIPSFNGAAFDLVRWGENGLAFRTSSGFNNVGGPLYLIQSALVSPTAAIPTGIQLSAQTYNVSENNNSLQVTVTRNGDLSAASTIDYATSDGTAKAGVDYTAATGTLNFAAAESSKTVSIPIVNDNVFEGNETFNFTLSNPAGGANVNLLDPTAATLTIVDNEGQPFVTTPSLFISEPAFVGTTTALFNVRLTHPTLQTATVNFTTANGTATAGSDYVATGGTLTFAPLETTKTIAVQILPDDNYTEPNETFTINFSNAVNASISGVQVTATILNYNPQTARHARFDFDGDGRSDIGVFRPSENNWYINQSQAGFTAANFGLSTDKIVAADYDGDNKTDIAVYRDGVWHILRSAFGYLAISFGTAEDIPQPADFDGDGFADVAVFRPSDGTWYVLNLQNNQFNAMHFGAAGDKPVVADYDGDRKADYAVFRPSDGTWYLLGSTQGFAAVQFGITSDIPVVGDYNGDGKADQAVFRPETGYWYLFLSNQGFTATLFGIATDLPVPGDYDGDGKTDIAVYRNGNWYLLRSAQGYTGQQFGSVNDRPLQNAFVP